MEDRKGPDLEELYETIMYPALQAPQFTHRREAIDKMVNSYIEKLCKYEASEFLDILNHISDEGTEIRLLVFKKGIEYGLKMARNHDIID